MFFIFYFSFQFIHLIGSFPFFKSVYLCIISTSHPLNRFSQCEKCLTDWLTDILQLTLSLLYVPAVKILLLLLLLLLLYYICYSSTLSICIISEYSGFDPISQGVFLCFLKQANSWIPADVLILVNKVLLLGGNLKYPTTLITLLLLKKYSHCTCDNDDRIYRVSPDYFFGPYIYHNIILIQHYIYKYRNTNISHELLHGNSCWKKRAQE